MEQLLLKDIISQRYSSLVSLDNLIPCAGATISEDNRIRVSSTGGVRTPRFKAGEDVVIYMSFKSAKPLTMKVGYLTSDGEEHLNDVSTSTSRTGAGGVEQFWKSFDAGGLSVYRGATEFFIQVEADCECEFSFENGSVRTRSELERLSVYAADLEGIIKNIDKRLAQLEYEAASKSENIAVSHSGKKFLIGVDDSGNVTATPMIPDKVLFVGNSLLLGMSFYGMCATSPKHDYFHYVSEHLRSKNPNVEITRAHGARFEQLEDESKFDDLWSVDPNPHTGRPFAESVTSDLDLIIIQLVENVNNEKRIETFEATIDRFLGNLKKNAPHARIVWVRSWWGSPRRDSIVEAACRRWNVGCISISDLYGKNTIGHQGQEYELADGSRAIAPELWLGHPGDDGMKAIADRIIDYLKL